MKNLINILILFLILNFCFPVFAQKGYDEKTIEKIMNCRFLNSSKCFEDLFKVVDDSYVRYYYGEALLTEKKYDEALNVFSKIKTQDREIIYKTNYRINEIKNLKEKMTVAKESDYGNYYNDLSQIVVWENYNNIKVYIDPESKLNYLFKKAFYTWRNAVPKIRFSFVNKKEDADIQCFFVNDFFDNKIGVTKYKQGIKIYNNKKYFVSPVVIEVSKSTIDSRLLVDSEILSVMLHEVGHALGILGHSKNINDLMYFSTDTYQTNKLSRRDINTINKIYK